MLKCVCDFGDGRPARRVAFWLDGRRFEPDLCVAHRRELGEIAEWFRVHGRSRRTRKRQDRWSAEVRAWGRKRGYKVALRGRLPLWLIEEWEAAHKTARKAA